MIMHGSDINTAALSGVKSLSDLRKLNIFLHLPNEKEANEDLWKAIRPAPPVKEKPVEAPVPEPTKPETE